MKKMTRMAIAVAVLLSGSYVVADAYDLTPGFLTTRAREDDPRPYPTVSRALTTSPRLPRWDAKAPMPDAAAVDGAVNSLSSDSRVTGRVSVKVVDAATGKTLAEREPDAARTPASNMKIVTAAVALRVLGPNAKLATTAKLEGDTLYLVGGGDTMLAAGAGTPSAVKGRAGLADLAEQAVAKLRSAGTTNVKLAVDSSLFEGPLRHPDVSGANTGFIMEMRPLAVMQSRNSAGAYTANPDLSAGQAFATALRGHGITVGTVSRGTAPASAATVGKVESAPVRDLVDFALTESDNTTSDVLGHLVAAKSGEKASFDGGGKATVAELKKMGVKTEGVVIADNSGLSDSNRLNATLLTEILKQADACDGCEIAALPAGLPVGALTGTLDDRFNGTEAAGRVRAKTGTLADATSLSGYVQTRAGRLLVFSVLIDDLQEGSFAQSRAALDVFVGSLAAT